MQQKPGSTETRVAGVLFSHQGEGIDYLPKGLKLTHVYVNECQAIDTAVRWAQRRPAELRNPH